VTEQNGQDAFIRLSDYEPTKLVKNDAINSSGLIQRWFPFCFALGLHGLFLWWLNSELSLSRHYLPAEIVTVLEFLESPKEPAPVEMMSDMQVIRQPSSRDPNLPSVTTNIGVGSSPNEAPPVVDAKSGPALNLYDETGRIRLPVDFIERLDQANTPEKRFDFRNPDLEMAGTFLKRPPAIDFNPTQFEQAWKPDKDILNELLDKAVEKTTKEIKIPVPGNPTVKLVCKVSVLALGGGCGFVPNGGYGRVVAENEDDPETLSPEEDRQCQAWWEKITNTRSQREWLKTKELYEITCKKPLAKQKA